MPNDGRKAELNTEEHQSEEKDRQENRQVDKKITGEQDNSRQKDKNGNHRLHQGVL